MVFLVFFIYQNTLYFHIIYNFNHQEYLFWSFHSGSLETNVTSIHEDACLIPGLTRWVGDPALPLAAIGCWHSSDLALLWLSCRTVAKALIWPLAQEPPVWPWKDQKKTQKYKTKQKNKTLISFPSKIYIYCGNIYARSWIWFFPHK